VIAVVDEAMIIRGAGSYILVAVLIADDRRAEARSQAVRLLPRRRRRFHFRSEAETERVAMLRLIADQAAAATALIASPHRLSTAERTRQQLLRDLAITSLGGHRTVELVLESRELQNDRLDRQTLIDARHAGDVPADLSYVHLVPSQEPLLWLADALAGAVRASLLGTPRYLELLPARLLTLTRRQVPEAAG
jgi:hypothetical protein